MVSQQATTALTDRMATITKNAPIENIREIVCKTYKIWLGAASQKISRNHANTADTANSANKISLEGSNMLITLILLMTLLLGDSR